MSTAVPFDADTTLMSDVTAAVKTAGLTLRDRYTPHARGVSLSEVVDEIHANDAAVLDVLREPLLRARRGSQWTEDELAGGALPPGGVVGRRPRRGQHQPRPRHAGLGRHRHPGPRQPPGTHRRPPAAGR